MIADVLAHWRSVLISVILGAFGYVKSYKEFESIQNEQVTASNASDTTREEKIKRMKESLGDDLLAGVDSVIVWENKYDLKFTCDNTIEIPISNLIDTGKLDGDIKNPINNENLTSKSVTVKFNCQTKQFTYDFDYNCQ